MADMPQPGEVAPGGRVPAFAADLTAASPEDAGALETVHSVVASAVAAGQRYSLIAGPGGGELAALLAAEAADTSAFATDMGEQPLVLRRDLPLQPPTGPGALPAWAIGRGGETAGPVIGALGQPVLVDSFAPVATTSLRRASASSPFLVIAGPEPRWDAGGNASLGAGSVWIAAELLDGGAPAGAWVGLTIAAGAISGATPTPGPEGVLVLSSAATLTLELELSAAKPTAGAGPGRDARDADVRAPGKVSFTFAPGGGHVGDLDKALLTAYGVTVRMRFAGGDAAFVPELAAIVVPLDADADEWGPDAPVSTLATLGGRGKLAQTGWALPITVANPSTLGAAGAGGLALQVEGLTLAFAAQARPVPAGVAWLLAQPGLITLFADAAEGAGLGGQVTLYPEPGGGGGVGGRATFRFADEFVLRYLTSGAGTEAVLAEAALDVSLDRPATAAAERVPLTAHSGVFALTQDSTATALLLEGVADSPPMAKGVTVALDNALLRLGDPSLFLVRGVVTAGEPELAALHGKAAIALRLRGALPTLPDPYASTLTPAAPRQVADSADRTAATKGSGTVFARLDWNATAGPVDLSLAFSQPAAARVTEVARATPARPAAGIRAALATTTTATGDAELLAKLTAMAEGATGSTAGPIALLDVSSNADQFGVRWGTALPPGRMTAARPLPVGAPAPTGPAIEGLSIVAPAHTIRVITLPAVQWEPVSGPDPFGLFSPMAFPDSGGESQLTSRSVRLVPVAPNPALAQMIADYGDESAPAGVVASITFPFGIRAVARLDPPSGRFHSGSELDLHRPGFAGAQLEGAQQLRAAAVRRMIPMLPAGNASFPGASVQLSNGLHNGMPIWRSPIDPLTDTFNGDFGPDGARPQVPVDHFELSGYGESVFSDWKDDSDDVTAITEVRFDVLNGRTSIEIVQARSILYPYGVRVIRTIKMLRDNAGRMQRTDSGWQAQTDGRYAWARPDVRTHPGVVLGVTRVENIRDTGQRWTSSDMTELMAVRFDCLVDLDGAVAGAGAEGAPSRGQLGFVQISDSPPHGISPAGFAELIDAFGPLGGPVDAVIDVGGSGQRSRVARVGAGVTNGVTGPEFAMAAWGSPVLPRGGPWSVVRRGSGDPAPGPVDPTLGVPLIRAGYAGAPPDPGAPYRFADPGDLATPDTPAADYALMHATNTQRVIFPRPKVELSGARAGELSSSEPPVLADPFLMATAVGLFPPVATAIRFPDADYGLRPLAGGDLALDLAHNDFQVSGGDRTVHAAGGNTLFVRYSDEDGHPAVVHLELDSSKPVPWAFNVGGVELGLATSLMGEVIRFLGEVDASAARPGRFTGGTIHFGAALDSIKVFTGFLGTNHLADLPLGSRNQPSLEIALKIPIVGGPGEPEDIDVGIGTLADADATVGVKVDLSNGSTSLKFELEGIITGRTPYPPLVAAGQVKFEIESGDSGNVFKFTLGFGVGVQADIGPFKAEAYFFQNDYLVVGTNEVGFGIGVELKASLDLGVVSAEVDVEAAALMIETTCGADSTLWLVAQLTIGVDITIAWVIDIDFEYQTQVQSNLDGGPCPAPMV